MIKLCVFRVWHSWLVDLQEGKGKGRITIVSGLFLYFLSETTDIGNSFYMLRCPFVK